MTQTLAFSASCATLRRLFRVRETVVLEVVSSYPQLQAGDEKNKI